MPFKNLEIHLNDHLAGAVGALKHIDRTREMSDDPATAEALAAIRNEISHDHDVLSNLMEQLGVSESTGRKLSARMGQVASALKFHFTPGRRQELRILQALDVLSVGIEGKKSLWKALSSATERDARLGIVDYAAMLERADQQLQLVDELRRRAAGPALAPE